MKTPVKVYLDNNILNDVAPKDKPWDQSKWGKLLSQLSQSKKIEVWASPANCLEIALNTDYAHRQNMALGLNTLIRGQRMMPAYETVVVRRFLDVLRNVWPGYISFDRLASMEKQSSQQYIGLLGQLAALQDYDCTAGFPGIIKPKIITQLIHTDIFDDPKAKLAERLKQLNHQNFSQADAYAAYDAMSMEDLQKLDDGLRKTKHQVDKEAVKFLQKNKPKFIRGYAREEFNFSIRSVFNDFKDAALSIGFANIVEEWESNKTLTLPPLPTDLRQKFEQKEAGFAEAGMVLGILKGAFESHIGWTDIYYRIIVNELERTLNTGIIPTGGVVLDGQHGVAALHTDIFICRDSKFLTTMKTIFSEINGMGGNYDAVNDLEEFKRKVAKAQP